MNRGRSRRSHTTGDQRALRCTTEVYGPTFANVLEGGAVTRFGDADRLGSVSPRVLAGSVAEPRTAERERCSEPRSVPFGTGSRPVSGREPAHATLNVAAGKGCCRPPSIPPEMRALQQRSRAWFAPSSVSARRRCRNPSSLS